MRNFRFNELLFIIFFLTNICVSNAANQVNSNQNSESLNPVLAHNKAFQSLNVRIRDPFVLLGPDNFYYLTGTTAGSHWGDTVGIKLWRSPDLINWESMGFVWDLYRDGKPADSWHFKQKNQNLEYKNPIAVWAPEIHFLNGTWWIPHCINGGGHGLLKSTTGKPEGPYEVMPPIETKQIDDHLFKDDDGTVYYCWQGDFIAKMNDSMTMLAENPKVLKNEGLHQMGYEGILMLKFNDIYVHIASGRYGYESSDTYDLYYATSKNIYGPYSKRKVMIKNAGHGNLFKDKNGQWWSTAFDHEFYDKTRMEKWSLWLVPVDVLVKQNDVEFIVKDDRFKPTEHDQKEVDELSKTGMPEAWKGKQPWYRPAK